MDFNIDSFL